MVWINQNSLAQNQSWMWRSWHRSIDELTAGIWRCGSCGKVEKSFFILNLHINTGCELSPIECDTCPAIFREYRNFVVHIMKHQMGQTRRCPICLCECIGDVSQHLLDSHHGNFHGNFSPSASELELHGSSSRSEERRVGKECSEPCRSRWSPYH